MTRRKDDGSWGEPQNLGYPINTKGNEGTLTVGLDGKTAYFARNLAKEGEKQNYDLFSFELPEPVRALPVTYAKAIVRDAESKTPLSTRLEFVDLATQKPTLTTATDETGTFLVCLPLGKNYALNVSKEGYIFSLKTLIYPKNAPKIVLFYWKSICYHSKLLDRLLLMQVNHWKTLTALLF
ncbi:MAG: hypothetical protein HC817_02895 [Saprospiraceae bacterium]|nr:hypothetical protein [Saprospiraceae bacterium]